MGNSCSKRMCNSHRNSTILITTLGLRCQLHWWPCRHRPFHKKELERPQGYCNVGVGDTIRSNVAVYRCFIPAKKHAWWKKVGNELCSDGGKSSNWLIWLDTWNDVALEAVLKDTVATGLKTYYFYAASKTESHHQARQWMKEEKPSFIFNTDLPNVVACVPNCSWCFSRRSGWPCYSTAGFGSQKFQLQQ